jgi:pimeloyl-ACP methyl ester carboxylesterase/DNA-binding CsgD family transcriptional regulator
VRIAFASAGDGPPLVKAPNWMNHLQYDWESPIWRPWVLEMARRYRLTSYDARGCGLSDRQVADHSFESHLCDLEAVVDAANLERFALLGMCQGAAFAIAYAARHPERVSRLILYGAYAQGKLRRPYTAQQRDEADVMVKLIEVGWGREDSAFRQVFTTQFIPDCTLEQVHAFDELQRVTASPDTAATLLRMFHEIDVADDACKVRCPTLVMHASGDQRVPIEQGRSTAALIPGAHFVELESRNHILLDHQAAWRQFFAALDAFTQGEAAAATAAGRQYLELTQREREVLELIARGLDNGQIAAGLGMSPKTVRNHINAIFAKLDVPTRARAIVCAREAGFGRKAFAPSA